MQARSPPVYPSIQCSRDSGGQVFRGVRDLAARAPGKAGAASLAATAIAHDTQTGRWLTPFRAVFDPMDPAEHAVVAGCMG